MATDAEHYRWLQKKEGKVKEFDDGYKKVISAMAARGFTLAPGNMLAGIIEMAKQTKKALTEANAQTYNDEREIQYDIDEFSLNLAVNYARLEFELYKQQVLNALEWETAKLEEDFKKGKDYIRRLETEINKRNAELIEFKAQIDSEIWEYRQKIESLRGETLDKELQLAEAKMETAQEKMKLIEPLQQAIDAEALVIAAEKRRAEALKIVLEIEKEIALLKEGLIPDYLKLAGKRQELADAIISESKWQKLLIELGYRETDLKDAQTNAELERAEKEKELEIARLNYIKAANALSIAKAHMQTVLSQLSKENTDTILELRTELAKEKITTQLDNYIKKLDIRVEDENEIKEKRIALSQSATTEQIAKLIELANSTDQRIRDCAWTIQRVGRWTIITQKIKAVSAGV